MFEKIYIPYQNFTATQNMGDSFNHILFEEFDLVNLIHSNIPKDHKFNEIYNQISFYNTEISINEQSKILATGSCLHTPQLFLDNFVWGSGILNPNIQLDLPFLKRYSEYSCNIYALRGKYTYEYLKRFFPDLQVNHFGDPGLLISKVVHETDSADHRKFIGIIPNHWMYDFYTNELDLKNTFEYKLLDPRTCNNFEQLTLFIRELNTCRYVITQSLHGLIFAHAYHIPAVPLVITDKNTFDKAYSHDDGYNGLFRFLDYYSGINMPMPKPIEITSQELNSLKEIDFSKFVSQEGLSLHKNILQKKQQLLIELLADIIVDYLDIKNRAKFFILRQKSKSNSDNSKHMLIDLFEDLNNNNFLEKYNSNFPESTKAIHDINDNNKLIAKTLHLLTDEESKGVLCRELLGQAFRYIQLTPNFTHIISNHTPAHSSFYKSINNYNKYNPQVNFDCIKPYSINEFKSLISYIFVREIYSLNDVLFGLPFYAGCNSGDICIDIGAGIGETALYLIKCKRANQVYSFEFIPEFIASFKQNCLSLDKQEQNKIVLIEKPIFDDETTVNSMYYQGWKAEDSFVYGNEAVDLFNNYRKRFTKKISATSVDIFCKMNNVMPNFIKICVPNAADKIISGSCSVLSSNEPPTVAINYCSQYGVIGLCKIINLIKSFNNNYFFFLRRYKRLSYTMLFAVPLQKITLSNNIKGFN